jgi:glycolate oxidase FAD binding subunit
VTTFAPRTADEVTDAIRWALAAGEPFEVVSSGSKRALGRPMSAAHRLDVSALSGVVSYEPAELVLTALPGTPLDTIEAVLAEHAQCLAFEPPNLAPLLGAGLLPSAIDAVAAAGPGGVPARNHVSHGTLGGAIATGLSGPRRPKAGAARDHVLGIAAASGRAERFVGGGKVVKNVTGYDIPKLMTGSHGTLAVLTEITLKVVPAPEDVRTLLVHGLSAHDAVRGMTGVLQSAVDVSGACHFPASLVAASHDRASGDTVRGDPASLRVAATPSGESATAFRLEGFRPSVEFRLSHLREQLARVGSLSVLDRDASFAFWRGVRDVEPFVNAARVDASPRIVWRLSVPPAEGAAVLERIERAIPNVQAFLDWGGGLIWLQLPETDTQDAHARSVRAAIGDTGGHAMLVRAPESVRATTEVFHPQPPGLAALSKRVKAQFDPSRVLNPGRMYADV